MQRVGWVRIVGVAGTIWNVAGVFSYFAHVRLIGDAGNASGGAEMPAAVTACFAIGVFGGVAGSIALAMLSSWARSLLWLSWAGTLIDWVWVFTSSDDASIPLGAAVLSVATVLVLVAEWRARRVPTLR
jgi:type III secretory pathway component EscS